MSKLQFVKLNKFGVTEHVDSTNRFRLVKHPTEGKYFIMMNSMIPAWQGDGFRTIQGAEDFLNEHDWENATEEELPDAESKQFKEDLTMLLEMYGFSRLNNEDEFIRDLPSSYVCIAPLSNDELKVYTPDTEETFKYLSDVAKFLDDLLRSGDDEVFSAVTIINSSEGKSIVQAAISTRDLSKNLVRVKSSNVWAYSINIRDRKDKTGDVLVQFKGKNGGPGDIYIYHDVPVMLWRQWLSASSKGHFFWEHIRNEFMYRKLTGDKRGKLKNAIN